MVAQKDGVLRTLEEQIDPRHTALVVVDVQNDFVHPDGLYGKRVPGLWERYPLIPRMLSNLKNLLGVARETGVLAAFVQAIYDPVYLSPAQRFIFERQGTYGKICLKGSFGAEIYEELRPTPGAREVIVAKHRFSAFWGTDLPVVLRSNGIKTMVMTGTVTSGCVEATARDGMFNDYYVVTVEDCCADREERWHQGFMERANYACGYVAAAAKVAAIWRKPRA